MCTWLCQVPTADDSLCRLDGMSYCDGNSCNGELVMRDGKLQQRPLKAERCCDPMPSEASRNDKSSGDCYQAACLGEAWKEGASEPGAREQPNGKRGQTVQGQWRADRPATAAASD